MTYDVWYDHKLERFEDPFEAAFFALKHRGVIITPCHGWCGQPHITRPELIIALRAPWN